MAGFTAIAVAEPTLACNMSRLLPYSTYLTCFAAVAACLAAIPKGPGGAPRDVPSDPAPCNDPPQDEHARRELQALVPLDYMLQDDVKANYSRRSDVAPICVPRGLAPSNDPPQNEQARRELKVLVPNDYMFQENEEVMFSQVSAVSEVGEVEENPSQWLLHWQTLVDRLWGWFEEERAVHMALGMVINLSRGRSHPGYDEWVQGPLTTLSLGVVHNVGPVETSTTPRDFYEWALEVEEYLWQCYVNENSEVSEDDGTLENTEAVGVASRPHNETHEHMLHGEGGHDLPHHAEEPAEIGVARMDPHLEREQPWIASTSCSEGTAEEMKQGWR